MKLFSRTSLVALSTVAAVTAASLTAPVFAEEPSNSVSAIHVADEAEAEGTSSGSSDFDMDEFAEYILLITGIVGALSAVMSFATALDRAAK